jgi:hypothetical protein
MPIRLNGATSGYVELVAPAVAGATVLELPLDSIKPAFVLVASQSFSVAASVSVNDCFAATYDNYLIVSGGISFSASDVTLNARLRVAAADSSAATYAYASLYAGSTVGVRQSKTGTAFDLGSATTGFSSPLSLSIGSPAIAAQTVISASGMFNGLATAFGHWVVGAFTGTTAFDGFTLYPASGTITGTVRVYGYTN